MTTPPPPPGPPNPGQGRLFGSNQLGGQMDALTRAFTAFTNRFASTSGMSSMGLSASNFGQGQRLGEQSARLQQRYQQTYDAHNAARLRMQEELERQQLQWDRQQRVGTRTMNNGRLPQWRRQEASDLLDEQGILFANAQARTRRDWGVQGNQHTAAMSQMNSDMDRLRRQQTTQTTMNRLALGGQAVGAVVGAARSHYAGNEEESLGQFERRFSLMRPSWEGTAGSRARSYGREMQRYGSIMWGTSNEDIFGGAGSILQQSPLNQYGAQMRRASSAAFVTPGLGIQGAAQMQQELGTAQAFYASQMFGLSPTRFAGGEQNSSAAMALSLAQRVNNEGFGRLTGSQLQAQLAQGGSLSMSMANYGRTAGLSGQSMEAMRNQTELLRDLMNPSKEGLEKLSSEQALQTIEAAGRRDGAGDKARDKIKKYAPSVGDSYQDSQRYLQGLDREGHLPASASYLDAAKASANSLADIHSLLQKTLEPMADAIGTVAGSAKGGGFWGSLKAGLEGGWNSGPNILFGDAGEGTDQSSWAKGVWKGISGFLGGDSGTPESKQGKSKKKKADAAGVTGGGIQGAINFARKQLGDRYILGAEGPDAWDCSSLMRAAFDKAGVSLPRVTYDQIKKGVEVPIDEVKTGDLVFYKDLSHVGLYTGNGRVLEAANPGKGVIEGPMYSKFTRARRVLSGSVAATESLSGKSEDPTASQSGSGGGFTVAGAYGSTEEVDALAAALAGGGGGGGSAQSVSRTPSATQNEESDTEDSDAGAEAPRNVKSNVALGKKMAASYGWHGSQWTALYKLWMGESGWRHWADNPTSDAYGIPQAMSNLHTETATSAWRNSPEKQIAWGLKYIKGRYGTPSKAWSFWNSKNPHWYKDGAWEVPGQQGQGVDARLHGGEMVLEANAAHTVRQALLNQGLNASSDQGSNATTSGSVSLQFSPGSVVVQMPAASAEGARTAAQAFVTHIAADDRIRSLMGGW
ncbi:NlpC/P60 family protein [Streptomyces sp. MMBL 11-1]|uniref:aggregation-promoting factor C-terminal-like domain-containing protein n=1 Tax=Streptomyces sp. MMBL 11-1 TaxID=3026420 RepID=UPI002360861B|nr:NlpC/P60 family protein [Streptomyces sp. MMBL 11-1]